MKAGALLKTATLIALGGHCLQAQAHDHMPAGATSSNPGATLEYAPTAADYTTNSGWVFGLNLGTTNDEYFGYY